MAISVLSFAPRSVGATIYGTALNGASEVPPVSTPGNGNILITLNGDILTVNEVFSGLLAPATAAHIHCCGPIGTNTSVALPFPAFPAATSGTYMHVFDLTDPTVYLAGFLTANGGTAASAETALVNGLNTFQSYANIHNSLNPGGEIRGQIAAVPEPGTAVLLLLGLPAITVLRRKR